MAVRLYKHETNMKEEKNLYLGVTSSHSEAQRNMALAFYHQIVAHLTAH
jgi:hypothetical protein